MVRWIGAYLAIRTNAFRITGITITIIVYPGAGVVPILVDARLKVDTG